MKSLYKVIAMAVVVFPLLTACHHQDKTTQAKTVDTLQIYGVRSGYYKTNMVLNASTAETWFSDWGNLQYTIITTENDPIRSYKIVRYGEEYLYTDYSKDGVKRRVHYLDYHTWENPSAKELQERNTSLLPTQVVMDKACKAFLVNDPTIPYCICFWKGIMMLDVTTEGEIISEVVDIRECSNPINMFDVPKDYKFVVERSDSIPAVLENEMQAPPIQ